MVRHNTPSGKLQYSVTRKLSAPSRKLKQAAALHVSSIVSRRDLDKALLRKEFKKNAFSSDWGSERYFLTLEGRIDRLFRNVGKKLPFYAA